MDRLIGRDLKREREIGQVGERDEMTRDQIF
jgi:hypothetical protein